MILTTTFESAGTPSGFGLSHYQSLVKAVAHAGIDAALFVRSPGSGTPMLDAVPLIAALASVPAGIGLGASIPADDTEPFHLARAFAAIDRLTRGRSAVVLDMAAGTDLARAIGRAAPGVDRYDRILEFFDATTKLWDSWEDDAVLVDRPAGLFTNPNKIHRINHDGVHYAVRGPLNAPRPIQGWPVIFMPVASGDEYAVAGRVADVALVSGSTPDDVRRTGAAISGNGDRVIRILADVVPILGQTVDEARRKANAVPDYPGDAFRFAGTPEQLAALMREWNTAGVCDGFNLRRSQLPSEVDLLVAAVTALARPPAVRGATLRDRLNLPRPASRYAA